MSDTTTLTKPRNDIRSFLSGDVFKEQVGLALPKHMTPDRFARVALTALTKTPKLMECTRESLLGCLMTCSQLGLEPDGIHAFLIPYKDTCTLIIGYRGLINLARRGGEVVVFRAELVKEEDSFEWSNGTVTHKIDWRRPRGKVQCVYAYVRFKDGSEDWEVLTMDEALSIRDRSQGYRAAIQYNKSHPWITDEGEMLKKTALRRLSKRLTLSPEFMDALDKDGDKLEERNVTPTLRKTTLLSAPVAEELPAPQTQEPEQRQEPELFDPRGELQNRIARHHIEEGALSTMLTNMKITKKPVGIAKLSDDEANAAIERWDEIQQGASEL